MSAIQRANRIAQAKGRGGHSYKTEMENAYLLLAWEAEQLSEGQVASMLDIDRVTLRIMRENAIARGMQIADGLLNPRPRIPGHNKGKKLQPDGSFKFPEAQR